MKDYITPRQMIKELAPKTGLLHPALRYVLQQTWQYIMDKLWEGKPVFIPKFGVFYVSESKRAIGYNFRKKQVIHIPHKYNVPRFRFNRTFIRKFKEREYNPDIVRDRIWRHKKKNNN